MAKSAKKKATSNKKQKKESLDVSSALLQEEEEIEDEDEEEQYEVEDILDERTEAGLKQYLIKWKGYGPKHNTWEPEENVVGCDLHLAKFQAKTKNAISAATAAASKPILSSRKGSVEEAGPSSQPPKAAVMSQLKRSADRKRVIQEQPDDRSSSSCISSKPQKRLPSQQQRFDINVAAASLAQMDTDEESEDLPLGASAAEMSNDSRFRSPSTDSNAKNDDLGSDEIVTAPPIREGKTTKSPASAAVQQKRAASEVEDTHDSASEEEYKPAKRTGRAPASTQKQAAASKGKKGRLVKDNSESPSEGEQPRRKVRPFVSPRLPSAAAAKGKSKVLSVDDSDEEEEQKPVSARKVAWRKPPPTAMNSSAKKRSHSNSEPPEGTRTTDTDSEAEIPMSSKKSASRSVGAAVSAKKQTAATKTPLKKQSLRKSESPTSLQFSEPEISSITRKAVPRAAASAAATKLAANKEKAKSESRDRRDTESDELLPSYSNRRSGKALAAARKPVQQSSEASGASVKGNGRNGAVEVKGTEKNGSPQIADSASEELSPTSRRIISAEVIRTPIKRQSDEAEGDASAKKNKKASTTKAKASSSRAVKVVDSADEDDNGNDSAEEEGEEPSGEYEVEELLGAMLDTKNVQWGLVSWKGYELKDCTWEPISNLARANMAVKSFYEDHGKPTKSKREIMTADGKKFMKNFGGDGK
ncbi:hypothetical protein BV898_03726 [Hypsibius exemplaris]|uniref:Chromo domain-containing protein n=1 Tax=Hypsibius exemplaris TaxID=2072580 RepID=A0A1W0X4F9_HYPEX|nr:hypothetical protein BV898_03726 [Hypsibius exemplaris]